MFRLAAFEFRTLKKYILIYIAVMMLMCSVIVSVTSFAYTTEEMIGKRISELSSGIRFEFVFYDSSRISFDTLEAKGFSDIRREYIAGSVFGNARLCSGDTECILSGNYIISHNGKAYDSLGEGHDLTIIRGDEIDQQEYSGIWISEGLADKLMADVGDDVYFSSDAIIDAMPVKVTGVFADADKVCNFVLSADIIDKAVNESQFTKRERITAVLPDYSACEKVMNSEEMKNANGYCYMYDYIYRQTFNIILTCGSLKVLSVILSVTAVLVLSAFLSTVIYKRMHYIGMLKSMGMTSFDTMAVYGIIIEVIIILSVGLSCPISVFLNKYISEEFNSIFSIISLDMEYNFAAIPTVFVLENVITLPVLAYLFKRIDKITAITVLKEND